MKTPLHARCGDDYVLTGQKRWITNGGVASFYTVFAPSRKAPNGTRGSPASSSSATTPGRVGRQEGEQDGPARLEHDRRDLRGRQGRARANIVGAEGDGFKVAMKTFDRIAPVDRRRRRRHHPPRARRVRASTRSSARRSACRSRSTRRCSSCSPRWRSPTRRRACSATRPRWAIDSGTPDSIVSSYAKAYGADAAMRVSHRRRADLRRLRLHQGVPGREADARREAAADLRRHQPDPAHGHRAQRARRLAQRH